MKNLMDARRSKRFLSFLLVLGLTLFPPGPARPEMKEGPPQEILYSFLDHLSEARAVRQSMGQPGFDGEWLGNRFRFIGLPDSADITVNDQIVVGEKTRPAIQFNALAKLESTLTFPKVAPGKRLHVFYGLADSAFEKDQAVAPVQFEIWLGKKRLLETRVSSKGWNERAIDLTIPRLLHRNFRYVFSVRMAGERTQKFVVYGYLE